MHSFSYTIKKEIISVSVIGWSAAIATVYLLTTVLAINYRFVMSEITEKGYPLGTKIKLIYYLIIPGLWTSFQGISLIFLVLNALLTGSCMVLAIRSVKKLNKQGKLTFSIGGAAIISLITAGCGGCGISILSLVGLASSLSFLPFKGLELQALSTIILAGSLSYLLYKLHKGYYCKR